MAKKDKSGNKNSSQGSQNTNNNKGGKNNSQGTQSKAGNEE